MRRFLEEKVDVVVQEQQEYSMEDTARMKIREKLLESALGLGILLNLSEQAPAKAPEDPLAPYMGMLRDEEGVRTKMYKDTKGIPTIGVGFNLTRSDAPNVFRQCFGDQCDDVFARANDPKRGMSAAEVEKLTRYDLENTFLPRTQKAVKGFGDLPLEARTALVSSAYRGSLLGSPKTLGLINAGKGAEAAAEYLRNKEYEKAKKTGSGVAGRMEREAEKFKLIGAPAAPATPAPAPVAAPAAPKQDTAGDYEEYEVRKGDTLSGISKRTGRSVESITGASGIKDPNKIGVGQKIRIPRA
jgi:GH24 family phage-related lysozyme (muramidase)